jgi:indolepyruvate ferredoxin oxidoreductase, alpha subunit
MQKVVDILTSYQNPYSVNAIGNEAIARGAIEAGVNGVFSYPGTPSTEISEIFNLVSRYQNRDGAVQEDNNKLYFEYSINEKVALEKAIAFSIGNKSSLCIMKNVGMNVASDALMSITYQTIIAPVVIIVCDDPGCHSSSNEQDSRYWGNMASVPLFNPASPTEAYEMTKQAFKLSEELRLPVIVRTTTRVSHSKGMLFYNEILKAKRDPFFQKMPEHINIPARTAAAHQRLLDKLNSEIIHPYFHSFNKTYFAGRGKTKAIISSGVSTTYLLEVIQRSSLENHVEVFDLGLIYPFPEQNILDFLNKGFKKVLIIEELDPIVETAVRTTVQKHHIDLEIVGENFAELSRTGEFSIGIVDRAVSAFLGVQTSGNERLTDTSQFVDGLPARPPALCSGCPHRATYYALKLATRRDDSELVLCGDIGCSGLGALPPLKMIDTINHMGMSISMAQGLSEALQSKNGKAIAMLGDGTFFHSGIASLLNAVYTRSNILVIIFDNRTIGMTGHQDHPGATQLSKYNEIDLVPLLEGMGVDYVDTLMPFDIPETYQKLNKAFEIEGVAVLVSKAPCVFLEDYKDFTRTDAKVVVDQSKCNTCHNHTDDSIHCSKSDDSTSSLIRALAKIRGEIQVDAMDMLCPANICNHGFFNSILEKDYSMALNMVRDKLLFARTCGDICHRPCELFSETNANGTIPIKELKKFVSGIEENFKDFSIPKLKVKSAQPKAKNIAVIGAGPAGLSSAYDLIREGYGVTIYEKSADAGGLIRHAIPDFRMDKAGFDFEVGQLALLGVEFKYNTALGRDIELELLAKQYDGVILAIGLGRTKKLDSLKGLSKNRCIDAISYLSDYNNGKLKDNEPSRLLVIGGGNAAIDAARTARRVNSSNEVILVCIEHEMEMPAFKEEIKHAKEEGILIIGNSYIEECVENDDVLLKLAHWDTKKFKSNLQVDQIIVAIGQEGRIEDYAELGAQIKGEKNRISSLDTSGYTNYMNVFVAGDISDGNHMSLIGAIASGKRAAVGVRQKLEGYLHEYEGLPTLLKLNNLDTSSANSVSNHKDEGSDIESFIKKFNLYQSCEKCNHCIDNFGCPALIKTNGKIDIDYSKCTQCGLCIDVCPNDAISWVTKEPAYG